MVRSISTKFLVARWLSHLNSKSYPQFRGFYLVFISFNKDLGGKNK
ncbi:hypothetical protein DLNHIDIE_03425 [Acidithiobacillus thiooxidans ATCC 19377]|jgi:hypothetical protein|uniref:Uncharacterized protein n=1 Tax=Acidithiobacillus thiooxidans ATCC 19377 TaxID=637390 RepID=A0A543PYT2_ACITH|nr:hypothetical protein DLNHIDIE_03425 [Acidithiobacillus thiooxidans ATCC 19377]